MRRHVTTPRSESPDRHCADTRGGAAARAPNGAEYSAVLVQRPAATRAGLASSDASARSLSHQDIVIHDVIVGMVVLGDVGKHRIQYGTSAVTGQFHGHQKF